EGTANEGAITTALDDGLFTVDCNDGNPCTNDSFNGSACVHTNSIAGTACGDPSSSACNAPDSCDGAGVCQANVASDGTFCGDAGTHSTKQDACLAGGCHDHGFKTAGTACGDPTSNACTAADTCNGSGTCQANNAADGTLCGDTGTQCTN